MYFTQNMLRKSKDIATLHKQFACTKNEITTHKKNLRAFYHTQNNT